jgi:DNA-binding MarR family transcriptional regulator
MGLEGVEARSQKELGERIGVDSRNLVAALDALELRGFVARLPDRDDRRRNALGLTDAGRQVSRAVRRGGAALEREMLAGLDTAEQARLRALLVKLARFVDDSELPAP